MNEAYQATPHADLLTEIMDPRVPKSEREWAANREIERLRDQVWRMSRNGADLTGFTPTRLLMRQLFEDMGTTLTLDIGPFGDGGSDDSVNIGPHAGFTSDCLVLSFAAGTNQHGFSPADAPAVRQLIQAVLGWLDYIEARQKEEQGR